MCALQTYLAFFDVDGYAILERAWIRAPTLQAGYLAYISRLLPVRFMSMTHWYCLRTANEMKGKHHLSPFGG